jgi:exodeoxyribonuclease V beta subunit
MNPVKPFDLSQAELEGSHLIEASAGTGKTYTLVNLCLRLIGEKAYPIESILIVTFTEAATQELAARLRQRLHEALLCLDQKQSSDHFFQSWLLPRSKDPQLKPRLQQALQDIDLAHISTIHAFCQWALSRYPLRSGQALQIEIISDQMLLLNQAIEDFWRKHMYKAKPEWVIPILQAKWSPECLQNQALPLLGLNDLQLLPLPLEDLTALASDWLNAQDNFKSVYLEAQNLWQKERTQILEQAHRLKGKSFQARYLSARVTALEHYFAQAEPHLPTKEDLLIFFSLGKIAPQQKTETLPTHSFFEKIATLLSAADTWEPLCEQSRLRWLHQLAAAVKAQLKQGKKARQQLSFDDLLLHLDQALQDSIQGPSLATALRECLPVALIDEFQDTDGLQAAIFKQIYPRGPLFLIGDPKQSIYSFRGADVQAYLNMRKDLPVQNSHSLDTNFRSRPALIQALEYLLKRENPFADTAIDFVPVKAGSSEEDWQGSSQAAPLHIAWLPSPNEKPWSKDKLQTILPTAVASEIAQRLQSGQYKLKDAQSKEMRPLAAQDIAVLVRTHKQGQEIRTALQRRNLPCVLYSQESVFKSAEAAALQTLLEAILQPARREKILQALAGPLMGLSATDLFQLQAEASAWEADALEAKQSWEYWLEQFQKARLNWLNAGFSRMWSEWVNEQGLYRRLLQGIDGERQVTNLRHLSELLQDYAQRNNPSLEALVNWLAQERQTGRLDQENLLLQLETDRQAIQILTIHRSKGLEFPVVFCPYLWDGKKIAANIPLRSHDPQTRQPLLDLGSPELEQRAQQRQQESIQEDLRLTYVALTRAKYQLWLAWAWLKSNAYSALGHWFPAESEAELAEKLQQATAQSGNLWQMTALDIHKAPPLSPATTTQESLQIPALPRIPAPILDQSFSTLRNHFEHSIESEENGQTHANETVELSPEQAAEGPLMDFPRGGRHGTFLHLLLEKMPAQISEQALQNKVAHGLKQAGYDPELWTQPLAQSLAQIWKTPLLPQNFCLADLNPEKRLHELEFHFPIERRLRTEDLLNKLSQSPRWAHLQTQSFVSRSFISGAGFFKGFIDLVCEHQGRYYVVDYKSNWLGNRWQDYGPEALENTLNQHLYPLQYHLYLVALDRYLRYRLPHYQPEQLGGAFVLFIRGMHPEQAGQGVFFEKPEPSLIASLSDCFGAFK